LQNQRKYSCGFPQNVELSIFVTILQEEIENWRRRVTVKGINAVRILESTVRVPALIGV
jgi:hypothetical protein